MLSLLGKFLSANGMILDIVLPSPKISSDTDISLTFNTSQQLYQLIDYLKLMTNTAVMK